MTGTKMGRPSGLPLVGRAGELARAGMLLEDVAQGRGRVLLLGGPAGIGKSRLTGEVLTLAARRGFVTLSGGAQVLGQGLAYAPLLEALGPYLVGLEPARRVRLVDGLPDLGRLFAELHLPPAASLGDPALERTRLFEAIARLLGRLAGQAPVVLAVDDLHWADAATVELLHYVARGIGAQRLLVVGAYRTDEPVEAAPLRALVRDLRRAGLAEELELPGLTPEAIRSLAAAVLGGEPPRPLVETLVARAAGSPLMVTGLIRELAAGGGVFRSGGAWVVGTGALDLVPVVVHDMVVGRLRCLAAEDRVVLELVALAGDAAFPPILAGVLGIDDGLLMTRLRGLAEVGLVSEVVHVQDVAYRTSHPAYAEVAYSRLGEAARRRLHAKVAEALERHRPGDTTLLAPHYRGAGGHVAAERALEVLLAAGEQALGVQAGAEAARYLEAARSHAAMLGDDRRAAAILERLGEAEQSAGRTAGAVAAWEVAVDTYRRLDEHGAVARVCHKLAFAVWDQGQVERAWALLADGVALASSDAELIKLREARVRMLGRLGELDAVEAEADELLALGERQGLPRVVAYANLCRAYRQVHRGDYERVRRTCRHAIATAEPIGDLLVTDHAYRQLISLELALGRHDQARPLVRTALRLARTTGTPTQEALAFCLLGHAEFLAGDWDEAQRLATEVLSLGHRVGSARSVAMGLTSRALVLAYRGNLADAVACLTEARALSSEQLLADRHLSSLIETVEALVAIERGDPSRALAIVEDHGTSSLLFRPWQLATLGESQVAAGRTAGAALATAAQIVRLDVTAPFLAALAARLTGLAAHQCGDHKIARRDLRRAVEGFGELAMPFEVARCRLAWAMAAATEHPEDAAISAQESLTTFTGLGARRFADRSRSLLRDLGVRPAPAKRRGPPAGGLSQREAEVVRLVAEGLSNSEIARRLVISPRTVTTHLQHVYARLDISSRVALVRYAIEHDLMGPAER